MAGDNATIAPSRVKAAVTHIRWLVFIANTLEFNQNGDLLPVRDNPVQAREFAILEESVVLVYLIKSLK